MSELNNKLKETDWHNVERQQKLYLSLEETPLNVVIEVYFFHFFPREIGPKLSTERWDDDMNCVVEAKEVYRAENKKCPIHLRVHLCNKL
jgi:hypothetical protein